MAALIYGLCAATSLVCAWLLLLAYGKGGNRLLFWSGLCFTGLTINNLLLVIDKIFLPPEIDLSVIRAVSALLAMAVLLYGFIFDEG